MTLLSSRTVCCLGSLILPVVLAVLIWQLVTQGPSSLLCYADLTKDGELTCRPKCERGFYSLPHMDSCQPWLTCRQILSEDFKVVKPLGAGAVKVVYLADYQGQRVAHNTLGQEVFREDFKHGLKMLAAFQPSVYVTQLIGYCKDSYVTEYHKLGTIENLNNILDEEKMKRYDTLRTRFRLCVNYVKVIHFLHSTSEGARVMCDSNDLQKTLNQFLLTSDLNLVVNDLDALPLVNHTWDTTVKCGSRRLYGDFVAPEQRWPFEDKQFDDDLLPGYDEKTDIWKIPEVCDFFLGHVKGSEALKFHLFSIHKRCKSIIPSNRPSALEVLHEYIEIQQSLDIS